jgi:hypothetical protein
MPVSVLGGMRAKLIPDPDSTSVLGCSDSLAIQMQDSGVTFPFLHPLEETGDGLFVVRGRERGGHVQSERPRGRQAARRPQAQHQDDATRTPYQTRGTADSRRSPRQQTIKLQSPLQAPTPVDHVILESFSTDGDPDFTTLFSTNLEVYFFGVVDKDAVPAGREVEGDVLVGLLGGGAAVYCTRRRSGLRDTIRCLERRDGKVKGVVLI